MKDSPKRKRHIFRNTVLCILGIWALVLITVQVILTPSVLTGIVNGFAEEFVDGSVSFGKVSTSVLKSFPNLNVTLHDFALTYPKDRFEHGEGDELLMRFGRGDEADTLASFREFSASVNLASLAVGQIDIPSVTLRRPRIFAKRYSDGVFNWNVLRIPESGEDVADTTSSAMPGVTLERIVLDGRPMVVYCDRVDTMFVFLNFKDMKFKGRLSTAGMERGRIGFTMDSLFVSGRMAKDTLALGLDRLYIKEHENHVDLEASAKAFMATGSMGRLKIPIDIRSHVVFPQDSVPAVSFHETSVNVAGIPLNAEADIRYPKDGLYVDGRMSIDNCRVGEVLRKVGRTSFKNAGYFRTAATISMLADFNARYGTDGVLGVNLDRFHFDGPALRLDLGGKAYDILGKDPLFDLKVSMDASLDTIGKMFRQDAGYAMSGEVKADITGRIRSSQMSLGTFAGADLKGYIKSPHLNFSSVNDSISVYLDSADIKLGLLEGRRASSAGDKLLALAMSLDSADINYKDNISLEGRSLSFNAYNSAGMMGGRDTSSKVHPLGGKLEVGRIYLKDRYSMSVALRNSRNSFRIYPEGDVPVLSLVSNNGGIYLRHPDGRLGLRDFNLDAHAKLTAPERKRKAKAFVDSLAAAHPDVPRDSLFRFMRRRPSAARQVPDWLTEDDFRKKDLDFKLDETLAKYVRDWDAEGNVSVRRASLMTPYFPLRTRVTDFSGHVTNNEVTIDSFNLSSGSSGLSATGCLSGLRRVLQGRGMLKLDLKASADSLHLNELFGALVKGGEYVSKAEGAGSENLDDDAFESMVTTDTLTNVKISESSLFVVPANLEADIALRASDVTYSTVRLDSATADIKMMQRCIQITNTTASSNIGNLGFEGFYSTRTKKDLKTGFRLKMDSITADKVIELMPAVDTIMPILKTFRGNLNCEIAATADLDTNMNVVMPSLNGVIRLGGKGLEIKDDPAIEKLMKILKFKNRERLWVDEMSVEGQLADNKLEIFPFILNVDRYVLGMSGIQNLDQTFRYHISIIKSPLLIRFGVDLNGNFDDFRFKIGKAKYRSSDVPVFSAVVDQASINLSNSIRNIFRKGVDEAVRENVRQEEIARYKERLNYKNAVDIQLDSLSDAEKAQLE